MTTAKSLTAREIAQRTGAVDEHLRTTDVATPKAQPRKRLNLLVHCGSQRLSLDQLRTLETPPGDRTHVVVPHSEVFDIVHEQVTSRSLSVVQSVHAVSKDGLKYFAMMEIRNGARESESDDFSTVLGLRNSHDKSFAASVFMGSQVFVCDNLCFSGEVKIGRRHTRRIRQDFPVLVGKAIDDILGVRQIQANRLDQYHGFQLEDGEVHDLAIGACDRKIINPAKIYQVVQEYREPTFEEFAYEIDLWRLFNAFTFVMKPRETGNDIFNLANRSRDLHTMLDEFAGFEAITTLGAN